MKKRKINRKIFKRGRRLLHGLPLSTIALLITAIIILAVLITTYSLYNVTQEQDINLEGIDAKIWIDGQPLYEQTYDIPDDVFSDGKLVAGEIEIFIHDIEVASDNGNFKATFSWNSDLCDSPEEEFFGFWLTVLDSENVEIEGEFRVDAGELKTFKIKHALDENFLDTSNPFPLDFDILLTEILMQLYPEMSYHFDENAGTDVFDDSGNGYDGTISGATWTTGKIGSALDFDGIDNYVSENSGLAGDFDLTDAFSLEAWIDVDGFVGDPAIISKISGDQIGYSLVVMPSVQKVQLILRSTGGHGMVCTDITINADEWIHVVATYSGDSDMANAHIYIDGNDETVTIQSNDLSGSITNTVPLLIGSYKIGAEPFDGIIDECVIYSHALTQDEVLWRFNEGNGRQIFTE